MSSVLRGAATYFFLLLVFRVAGKRAMGEMTAFDFVLMLIISETTQAALLDNDNSLTNSFILITTLVLLDILLSLLKRRWERVEKFVDGVPLVLLIDGTPLTERMTKSRVDEADILVAARATRGLERLDQIKYAVLEENGGISIVAKEGVRPAT